MLGVGETIEILAGHAHHPTGDEIPIAREPERLRFSPTK
jgi:hypothetical protein